MPDNSRQISTSRAQAAFDAYKALHEGRESTQLRDLLADLMHLAAQDGIDFDQELSMATDFYGDELAEDDQEATTR